VQEPANQSRQPVQVKLVLPRWLIRGLIAFFALCFVIVAVLFIYSIYLNKQARNIYPPEKQRRDEVEIQKQLDNSRRKVEEGRHPTPTPTTVTKPR
jgi:flagellar biosynthesis/type III secretory pathway M-ring protein FliF/YscJ